MKVKMLVSMAGTSFCRRPGDVVEVSGETGAAWVAAKIAVEIYEKPEPVIEPKPIQPGRPAGRKKR